MESQGLTHLVVFFQVLVEGGDRGEEDDRIRIVEEWYPGVSLAPRSANDKSDESAKDFRA